MSNLDEKENMYPESDDIDFIEFLTYESIIEHQYNSSPDENESEEEEEEEANIDYQVSERVIDYYLKCIARNIYKKLQGKESGAVHPLKEIIPRKIWLKIADRMREYGAETKKQVEGENETELVCYIRKQEAAERIFSHTRLGGQNYLMKITKEKRRRYSYCSTQMACVILSNLTPITFTYTTQQELYVSFFIQRYDAKGAALSPCLQALADISM